MRKKCLKLKIEASNDTVHGLSNGKKKKRTSQSEPTQKFQQPFCLFFSATSKFSSIINDLNHT